MSSLFGHLCSGDIFPHDAEMMAKYQERKALEIYRESQRTESRRESQSTGVDVAYERWYTPEEGGEDVVRREEKGESQWSLTSQEFCQCHSHNMGISQDECRCEGRARSQSHGES